MERGDKFILRWNDACNKAYTNDYTFVEFVRKEYNIIAKGIGTLKKYNKQNKLLTMPFIINKNDTLYLFEKGIVKFDIISECEKAFAYFDKIKVMSEYKIYKDLKGKGYFLTSGFKYGYDPNFVHSEYMIFVKDTQESMNVHSLITMERISVSTKKRFLVAEVDNKDNIKYINFEWLKL